jgi:hypothetical protein
VANAAGTVIVALWRAPRPRSGGPGFGCSPGEPWSPGDADLTAWGCRWRFPSWQVSTEPRGGAPVAVLDWAKVSILQGVNLPEGQMSGPPGRHACE